MILARKVDVLNMKQNSKPPEEKTATTPKKDSMAEKKADAEKKRWWFIILSIVCIMASKLGGMAGAQIGMPYLGYYLAGAIALIGVHIIWYHYPEETGKFEKWVLNGIILFYGIALVFPQIIGVRDAGWSIAGKALTDIEVKAKLADANYGNTQATQQGGIPASIIAVKEKPSDWILLPENKNIASTCNGDGVMYIRHSKSPPEGFGPYPCTPNGIAIDFGKLNGGNRLINAEVRYQSTGEPFVVNFRECPTSTSCVMRVS